jgi:hypothetical protein
VSEKLVLDSREKTRTRAILNWINVATAQRLDATVLTGDAEFESVKRLVKICWLPK